MSSLEFSPTMEQFKPQLEENQNVNPNFSLTNQPKEEVKQEDEENSNSAVVEVNINGEEEGEENPNLNPNPNPKNQEDSVCLDCHSKLECPNCHANQFNKNQDIPNVPGFRFNPLDYELIVYYLQRKVRNEPLPHNKIREVELYKSNPDDLAENYPGIGEKQWYFFTPRDRKYKNGTRPNRAAGSGYWKATGADKPVYYMGVPVGHRKALVFYHGKAPKGDKTNWIMHEYRVDEPPRNRTSDNDMRLDDWVLCRIYKKDDKIIKAPKHNEESNPPFSDLSDRSSPLTETDLGENPILNHSSIVSKGFANHSGIGENPILNHSGIFSKGFAENPILNHSGIVSKGFANHSGIVSKGFANSDYNHNGIVSKGFANHSGIVSKGFANNSYINYSHELGAIQTTINNHLQPNFNQPPTVRHPVFPYQSVFYSEDWAALTNLDTLPTNYIDPMLSLGNILPNNGAQTNDKYHQ